MKKNEILISKKRKLRKIEDEIWRIIPYSDGLYQVSNYGRVKSFVIYKKDGQILKCSVINGFKNVQIASNKNKVRIYNHKLVAQIWIPKPTDRHTYVSHIDGNLKNNHISNLEWHTRETLNAKHSELNKGKKSKNKRRNSKLKESDIGLLKSMLERGVVQSKIAKMFRISEMQVTRIKRGENWGYVKPLRIEDKK
ncbi:MAG: hypothetical protein GQ527_04365 [Bacteroidales bacterium]|nr:hypothetical protein [Bacteroidales bacterium]